MRALLLGAFQEKDGDLKFTPTAEQFSEAKGLLAKQRSVLQGNFKKGESRTFYGLSDEYPLIALVHGGAPGAGFDEAEQLEEGPENVRVAVAAGMRALWAAGATAVDVDVCGQPQAAAEACVLSTYSFDELKKEESRKKPISYAPFGNDVDKSLWERGLCYGKSQNVARRLMEMPANLMTPTIFVQFAKDTLAPLGIEVIVRDRAWAEGKKMGSFLSVAQGSAQPCFLLEMHYRGNPKNKDVVHALVGKGITFDSGGISLKPSAKMDKMRADMGGAACVLGTMLGAATLKVPVNLVAITPLTENMPGGKATKPGDVVTAMNGKTIQIDNTDAEGRLVLADALCYVHEFKPKTIVDMATLTGAMMVALGGVVTGSFVTTDVLWNMIWKSGTKTGDRFWRMPLMQHYGKMMTAKCADLNNISKSPPAGGSCTAAAFLKEFVEVKHWAHLDIAGVMENSDEVPYLDAGMSGRPVRSLIEYTQALCQTDGDW